MAVSWQNRADFNLGDWSNLLNSSTGVTRGCNAANSSPTHVPGCWLCSPPDTRLCLPGCQVVWTVPDVAERRDAVCCKVLIKFLFCLFVICMWLDIVTCSFPQLFLSSVRSRVIMWYLTDCGFVLLQWMKDMWRSDPCYASYGVDGSTCSFFIYLSEVSNLLICRWETS